ncbi:type II toxin-antitoxin system VapB family antitoxin [Rudaeicoccus suwonensis]|uniref:VapB protein of antitoxin of type II toxin-antitoxin system n=1 Tax=Rudaeicoccus suwonensis TaxID=657409 RepID=A0A561EBI2_9MICO|nr:type II toxin-antitoxin system VapB family antitoxin [Rudaeicoccus suwonensis]TWE12959.1 VapB protein of antitoxin of type II toxin-antitoxin system [Rudaeicoccus suwonensis]
MTKTLIDLDDELIRRAQEVSGISTKKGVVMAALEEMVRRDDLRRYADYIASGAVDDLADPDVMRAAHR